MLLYICYNTYYNTYNTYIIHIYILYICYYTQAFRLTGPKASPNFAEHRKQTNKSLLESTD